MHDHQSVLERTLFRYKEYGYRDCAPNVGCGPVTYKTQATSWSGGDDLQQTGLANPFTHCVPELAGSTWHRGNTKASTWTNGVAISKVIGIDLSAQTGYTNETTHTSTSRGPTDCADGRVTQGRHRDCSRPADRGEVAGAGRGTHDARGLLSRRQRLRAAAQELHASVPAVGGKVPPYSLKGGKQNLVLYLQAAPPDGGYSGPVSVTYDDADGNEHLWVGGSAMSFRPGKACT